jgi:hypothetical protein
MNEVEARARITLIALPEMRPKVLGLPQVDDACYRRPCQVGLCQSDRDWRFHA